MKIYSILFKCSCNKWMICSLHTYHIYTYTGLFCFLFFLIHPNDRILWLKLSVYTHWSQCPLTFPELISDAHSICWILEQSPSSSETSLLSLRPPCKLVVLKLWGRTPFSETWCYCRWGPKNGVKQNPVNTMFDWRINKSLLMHLSVDYTLLCTRTQAAADMTNEVSLLL